MVCDCGSDDDCNDDEVVFDCGSAGGPGDDSGSGSVAGDKVRVEAEGLAEGCDTPYPRNDAWRARE